jgi:hypothetical protein
MGVAALLAPASAPARVVTMRGGDEPARVRLKELRARAAAEGIDRDSIDDAFEMDDPRAALLEILAQRSSLRRPQAGSGRILSALQAGGQPSMRVVTGALEHTIETLERRAVSCPRESRRGLWALVERAEEVLHSVDRNLCDAVARCDEGVLRGMCAALTEAQDLSASEANPATVASTSEAVLDLLDQCRRVAMAELSNHRHGPVSTIRGRKEFGPEPELEDSESAMAADLIIELRQLKPSLLSKRALSTGVDPARIDAALDADDSKQALIDLVVECESKRGPEERIVSCLAEGGAACAAMVMDALEDGMDVLEQLSMSSPRKSRKALLETMERVEALMDDVDEAWCNGMCRCGEAELGCLSGQLMSVRELSSTSSVSSASDAVVCLMDGLDRCGSAVLQSLAVLRAGGTGGGSGAVLGALSVLRGLGEDRLEVVSVDECAAFDAVMGYLSSSDRCAGMELESACVSLFKLGCRNGFVVCARAEVLELFESFSVDATGWLVSSSALNVLRTGAAVNAFSALMTYEVVYKSAVDVRASLEPLAVNMIKATVSACMKLHSSQRISTLMLDTMKSGLMEDDEPIVACGALYNWAFVVVCHASIPSVVQSADDTGALLAALNLHKRIMPSPLPASWWVSTCDVIDATSARLSFGTGMGPATLKRAAWRSSGVSQSARMWLNVAIDMVKMNMEARLTARDRMNPLLFYQCLGLVEVAARQESQHRLLLESGVAEALEYTCLNEFAYVNGSLSLGAVAAGGAVALLGRNEDGAGKTLSRESVFAVIDSVALCFEAKAFQADRPMAYVASNFSRVATMCISDANKRFMVEHGGLVQMLLHCLVVDAANPRKGQEGAEALQESCAGVFQELALFELGGSLLRSHGGTLDALRAVVMGGSPQAKERASAALFELEEEKRGERLKKHGGEHAGLGVGGGDNRVDSDGKLLPPPPHVMASYNWDHQEVIMRVVVSLQGRGYLVWVDLEQMKGASVDTMALAVEGSEVVLIGVSRAYKESSNCRMEAQYALQKRKALIPLMLVRGYEADGWLGLLLGTSIWYAFYDETLQSESAFESRMDALCREVGDRGRANAGVSEESTGTHSDTAAHALREELAGERLRALQERAASEGVAEEDMDVALESDRPKAALIDIIVHCMTCRAGDFAAELRQLRPTQLKKRARAAGALEEAIDASDDAKEPKEALIALIVEAEGA